MQECIEAAGQFVVSRGEATEFFELIEESFDEVPDTCSGASPGRWIVRLLRGGMMACSPVASMHVINASLSYPLSAMTAMALDQRRPLDDIGHLPTGKYQSNRIAQRIDRSMPLDGQPTPRAAARLIATVFLGVPAAC